MPRKTRKFKDRNLRVKYETRCVTTVFKPHTKPRRHEDFLEKTKAKNNGIGRFLKQDLREERFIKIQKFFVALRLRVR